MTKYLELNPKLKTHQQSYPIMIGENILQETSLFAEHIQSQQVFIITNTTVGSHYLETLLTTLKNYSCETLILPDGERYKTLETMSNIFDTLIETKQHRDTTLIALGGGVIGDITGFAAACYCRGVNIVQVPTTLLAQVDSSIGGKTGINFKSGKNLIGAFYQPHAVIIDTKTLNTLPNREYKSAIAEVIKYGLITDADFFNWLEENSQNILKRNHKILTQMIHTSCEIKANIVSQDEKEQGLRSLLNLGHTFGHAIESATDYQQCLHGEAVALGIRLAATMSHHQGWLSQTELLRIHDLLDIFGFSKTLPPQLTTAKMLELMQLDKKIIDQQLRLVLLKKIGEATTTDKFDHKVLQNTIEAARFSQR